MGVDTSAGMSDGTALRTTYKGEEVFPQRSMRELDWYWKRKRTKQQKGLCCCRHTLAV